MEPYRDPLRDQMDELARSMELSHEPGLVFYDDPDAFMDPWARLAGRLEASIEGTDVRPPNTEPPPLAPEPSREVVRGYTSDGPPPPPESYEHYWTGIEPAAAAKPLFTPEGMSSTGYRSHGRMGTGITHNSDRRSGLERWCPDAGRLVSNDICESCDHWGDHDKSGFESCDYDTREESVQGDDKEINGYCGA